MQRPQHETSGSRPAGALQHQDDQRHDQRHAVQRQRYAHQGPVTREHLQEEGPDDEHGKLETAQQVAASQRNDAKRQQRRQVEKRRVLEVLRQEVETLHLVPPGR